MPKAQNTERLALTCQEAGWKVNPTKNTYVCYNPRTNKTVHVPTLAADARSYEAALKRLKAAGLDDDLQALESKAKVSAAAKMAEDRERNDRRMEAVAAKASKATPTMTVAAPATSQPDDIDLPQLITPATIAPPQFSSAATVDPAWHAHGANVPDELVGVAGLLSLPDGFDLSQIITRPEDRPQPGPFQVTVYEVITPERAFELLYEREPGQLANGTMLRQRSLSPTDWKRYMGILQRDLLEQKNKANGRPYHAEWLVAEDAKLAPEPPVNTGGVVDGQHRMRAIFEANIPAIMRVTYNTPPEVFIGLNQGRKRTDGDIWRIKGIAQSSHFGSAAKMLWCWWNWRNDPTGPFANWKGWSRMRPTTIQLEDFLTSPWPNGLVDPDTGESLLLPEVAPGSSMMTRIGGVPAAGIGFRLLVKMAWRDVNPELGNAKLEEFCTLLGDGAGPGYGKDHPCYTVREWITRGTGGRPPKGGNNYKREWQLNGMLRALDYFAHGLDYGRVIVAEESPMPLAWAPGLPSLTDGYDTRRSRPRK